MTALSDPWAGLTRAQRMQFREAHAANKEREMQAKLAGPCGATAANAEAVAERIRETLRHRLYSYVNTWRGEGEPDLRVSQKLSSVKVTPCEGREGAMITVSDTYGLWFIESGLADRAGRERGVGPVRRARSRGASPRVRGREAHHAVLERGVRTVRPRRGDARVPGEAER